MTGPEGKEKLTGVSPLNIDTPMDCPLLKKSVLAY